MMYVSIYIEISEYNRIKVSLTLTSFHTLDDTFTFSGQSHFNHKIVSILQQITDLRLLTY